MDYGTLMCWADNAVGQQKEPCVFHVIAAGKPDSPYNCTLVNQTSDGLEVDCNEGKYQLGMSIQIYDELLSSSSLRLFLYGNIFQWVSKANLISHECAMFTFKACIYEYRSKTLSFDSIIGLSIKLNDALCYESTLETNLNGLNSLPLHFINLYSLISCCGLKWCFHLT